MDLFFSYQKEDVTTRLITPLQWKKQEKNPSFLPLREKLDQIG